MHSHGSLLLSPCRKKKRPRRRRGRRRGRATFLVGESEISRLHVCTRAHLVRYSLIRRVNRRKKRPTPSRRQSNNPIYLRRGRKGRRKTQRVNRKIAFRLNPFASFLPHFFLTKVYTMQAVKLFIGPPYMVNIPKRDRFSRLRSLRSILSEREDEFMEEYATS